MAWDKLCRPLAFGGQGFKDIHAFNAAMLAKTWWRLIQNEDLLSHQVLVAKYGYGFPLHKALRANKCSYLWKSLMIGKEIVDEGMLWRIGDGRMVDIWSDRWLKLGFQFRPQWHRTNGPPSRLVASLIDPLSRSRDYAELTRLFDATDVTRIMAIPLGRVADSDRIIWNETKNGQLTVKSAYKVACRLRESDAIADVYSKRMWIVLWKTMVAPRIRNFMWRVFHNIIPTMEVLRSRRLGVDPLCPVCHAVIESCFHTLFDCTVSAQVWNEVCPIALAQARVMMHHVSFWEEWFWEMHKALMLELSMVVCWALWKNRNQVVHDARCLLPSVLGAKAVASWKDYVSANVCRDNESQSARQMRWVSLSLT